MFCMAIGLLGGCLQNMLKWGRSAACPDEDQYRESLHHLRFQGCHANNLDEKKAKSMYSYKGSDDHGCMSDDSNHGNQSDGLKKLLCAVGRDDD